MFQKKERIEFRLLGGNEGAYTFLREKEKRGGGGVITRGGGGGSYHIQSNRGLGGY